MPAVSDSATGAAPAATARAERVRMPRAPQDRRKRAILTDVEFLQWESAVTTSRQLRAMAWCSRAFGGISCGTPWKLKRNLCGRSAVVAASRPCGPVQRG